MKTLYHACEVCTHDRADMWVDTDPLKLLENLGQFLDYAQLDGGAESIIIGTVEAESIEDAITGVRAEEWATKHYAFGVTPEAV